MIQSIRTVAGVAAVMLWAGVALAQNVIVDYRQGLDFSGYQTFRWIKPPNTVNPLDQQRVIDQVNSALATKGLRLVTGEADLCIAAHTATEQERTLNTFYDGFGGGWQWRGSGFASAITTVSTYDVGTLVVDIFDSRMKEAIWRGTSMKTLSENSGRNAVNLNKSDRQDVRAVSAGGRAPEGIAGTAGTGAHPGPDCPFGEERRDRQRRRARDLRRRKRKTVARIREVTRLARPAAQCTAQDWREPMELRQTSTSRRRSSGGRALTALEQRIRELEQLANSQGRELRIQFERIAQLQAEHDILRIRSMRE